MMLQMSQMAFTILNDFDQVQGVFSGDIYPLIAPQKADLPLAVYQVSKSRDFSKHGVNDVNIDVVLVGRDYDALCQISDNLEDYVKQNYPSLDFISALSGVNPEDQDEFNITMKFNAKMI